MTTAIDGCPVLLTAGTRIRSKSDPTLLGYIDRIEFCKPGQISAIPYCFRWDDERRAVQVLGVLGAIYGGDWSVEVAP